MSEEPQRLKAELGLGGALLLGLGSMVGTGIYVSLGLAAGRAGPWLPGAIGLAALVALLNGLSSSQLAAAHPVAGGTYEYAHRFLHPLAGWLAGWTFLIAKSASAAAAALGLASYLSLPPFWQVPAALLLLGLFTALAWSGLKPARWLNAVLVTVSLGALAVYAGFGVPHFQPDLAWTGRPWDPQDFFGAAALVFVAFTGYGRIATLGEEAKNPRKTIPRAILITVVAVAGIYLAVAVTSLGLAGGAEWARLVGASQPPLERLAVIWGEGWGPLVMAAGAAGALAGVLLNLLLGLSRVVLAFARRGELPRFFSVLDSAGTSPRRALAAVAVLAAVWVLPGRVALSWSVSAFAVLVYYALTNAASFALPKNLRRLPRLIPAVGLILCFGLAWFVDSLVLFWGGAGLSALVGAWLVLRAWRSGRRK